MKGIDLNKKYLELKRQNYFACHAYSTGVPIIFTVPKNKMEEIVNDAMDKIFNNIFRGVEPTIKHWGNSKCIVKSINDIDDVLKTASEGFLVTELNSAIINEDFEKAAKIRDELKRRTS